jgi:two-component system, OmpR family, sensor histidine kinase KdpD
LLRDRRVLLPADASRFRVRCDLTLTVQILGNLLQNAARYSPADAPIEVRVDSDEQAVRIVVADRGPGLADMDLERLFTPLRRPPAPESDTASEDTRMGMGLSIARTFARAQRGDVTYAPRAGGGSEFTLRLPRAAPATT